MRILIQDVLPRHRSILEGYASAFRAAGHIVGVWEEGRGMACYDAFAESLPDIYIATKREKTRAEAKCIEARGRHLRIIQVEGLDPGFDTLRFPRPGVMREGLACDVCFVGDYRPEKQELVTRYIQPCMDAGLRVKLFGRTPWAVPEYLGYISDENLPDLYASAKVCLDISEARLSERAFQIMGLGGVLVLNSRLDGYERVDDYSPEVVLNLIMERCDEQLEFDDRQVDQSLVLQNHTYFHRISAMFRRVSLDREAERALCSLSTQYAS